MYKVEHTDTFGGEANYCWLNRYELPDGLTDAQLIRRAKKLCGLNGVRARVENFGGDIAIYPSGICQVVFISYTNEN